MSAEDVGRVGGTERRGGEGVSERRYRMLTCFGLISGRTLCAEATGFNLGVVVVVGEVRVGEAELQHLELIITRTPALLLPLRRRAVCTPTITSNSTQTLSNSELRGSFVPLS